MSNELLPYKKFLEKFGISEKTARKWRNSWLPFLKAPDSNKLFIKTSDFENGLIRIDPGKRISQEADEIMRKLRGGE